MIVLNGKYNHARIMIDHVDEATQSQIINFLNHPAFAKSPIVIMPDCLADNTEVLTRDGFKLIKELKGTERIANVDPTNRKVSFSLPTGIINRPLRKNEKVFSLTNKRLNFTLVSTEKHRNAYKPLLGMTTDTIPVTTVINDYMWNGSGLVNAPGCNLSGDEIRLVAWIVGDGNIKVTHNERSDNFRIRFGFKKQRKIKRVLQLCKRLGLTPKVCQSEKQTEIYINTEESKKFISIVSHEKTYPIHFITSMTSKEAKILLNEAVKVDGDYIAATKNKGGRINSKNKKQLDILAALVAIHFGTSNIKTRMRMSNLSHKSTVMHHVNIVSKNTINYDKSGLGKTKVIKNQIEYHNNVVCVTCQTGFFIARQNGRTFITGNCHYGKGAVIGFTMPLRDHVIPNIVGVDLGCGVYTYKLGKIKVKFREFDFFIKETIPNGGSIRTPATMLTSYVSKEFISTVEEVCSRIGEDLEKTLWAFGTLGGGNHYIELNEDQDKNVWLSLHSGSRHFGLAVANFHQKKAKELMLKMFHGASAYNGLEFLPMDLGGEAYMKDMRVAQQFAHMNRSLMAKVLIEDYFNLDFESRESIKSVHNFIGDDDIIRKGAISAREGERVIIPLNMRDGAIIGVGKGSSKWNFSAPHGAGRKYSRKKAKEKFTLRKFEAEMKGIWSSCVKGATLDESPMAYKDASDILDTIDETVEVQDIIKPIYNFKATS